LKKARLVHQLNCYQQAQRTGPDGSRGYRRIISESQKKIAIVNNEERLLGFLLIPIQAQIGKRFPLKNSILKVIQFLLLPGIRLTELPTQHPQPN
jgi:hypothetical protein